MARLIPPKHSGVSQLADTAKKLNGEEHYPVKQKRQARRLKPNWDAIRWLEDKTYGLTEIEYIQRTDSDDGLYITYAAGRAIKSYPRPMFQVIGRDAFSGGQMEVHPCEACDNFAYSWNCETHPVITYDERRKVWNRPVAPDAPPTAYYSPEEQAPTPTGFMADSIAEVYRQITAAPQWEVNDSCPCGLCNDARQRQQGRRERVRGQWVAGDIVTGRDILANNDQVRLYASPELVEDHPVNAYLQHLNRVERFNPNTGRYEIDHWMASAGFATPQVAANPDADVVFPVMNNLAGEYTGILSGADVSDLFQINSVPGELVLGAEAFQRYLGLTDGEISGTFELVVEGETHQGIDTFSIEVEEDGSGRTS